MIENNFFEEKSKKYWNDFLIQNNLISIKDYKSFKEKFKKHNAKIDFKIISGNHENTWEPSEISNSIGNIINKLYESVPKNKKIFIFIDDITDHLDKVDSKYFQSEVNLIQDLLIHIDRYNSSLLDNNKTLKFICCIRDDLFEYMESSNLTKIKHNMLKINWKEKDFASLLIKRLPIFSKDDLENPEKSILKQFPDDLFCDAIKEIVKDNEVKRFKTNFYAFMVSISFNRPRDFLKFCYCLKERLSEKHSIEFLNIEAAEIEYSDYFLSDLKDELLLLSKIESFDCKQESINELFYNLSKSDEFNFLKLKNDMAKFLGIKASKKQKISNKKIIKFIRSLWSYGILGFKSKNAKQFNFKYLDKQTFPFENSCKEFVFILHRGIRWALHKKMSNKYS